MKKLFALLLALSLCFALVGCDNNDEPVEVPYIYGNALGLFYLTIEEFDNYVIYHGINLFFGDYVGFCRKDKVTLSTKTLNTYGRELMKRSVKLNKNDILAILGSYGFEYITEDFGFVNLNNKDYSHELNYGYFYTE